MCEHICHRRLDRWLACILMSGLIVNLHLFPAYRIALADDLRPVEPLCLPVPISPAMQQLIGIQQTIHERVFASTYNACEDVVLLLDEEPTEAPAVLSGRNAQDEVFIRDVSVVDRVDDWTTVGWLTPEQIGC